MSTIKWGGRETCEFMKRANKCQSMRRIKLHMTRLKYPHRSEREYEEKLTEEQRHKYLDKHIDRNNNNNKHPLRRSVRIKSQKTEANIDESDKTKHKRKKSKSKKKTNTIKSKKKKKRKASKHGSRWTKDEENELLQLHNSGESNECIAKKLNRTKHAIISRLSKLNVFSKKKTRNNKVKPYEPWTIRPYPQKDHKGIGGNFWCCSCSKDDGKQDIILCDHCQDILSHSECFGMDENDYYECPKCKYVTNYQCKNKQNVNREWTDEDVIRVIIMIDMNLGMDEMLNKLNCDFPQFSVLYKKYEQKMKKEQKKQIVLSEETESDSLSDSDFENDLNDDANINNVQKEVVNLLSMNDEDNNNNNYKKRKRADDDDEDGMPSVKKQRLNGKVAIDTVNDVLAWFHMIGYGEYINTLKPRFEEDEVDGMTLPLLNENHLKSYGIHRLYDRIMIIKEIKKL